MLKVNGLNIDGLPFEGLVVKTELLSFEYEAMLNHSQDNRGDDWLCYWADFDESGKRWLYAKVSRGELYDYLIGNKSLKQIFAELKSEYVFLLDFDLDEGIRSVKLINSYAIPKNYFPGSGSFYKKGLSEYYYKHLHEDYYLESLKKKSFVFTAEPADLKHGHTLGTQEGGQLLTGLTKSVRAYVEYEVNDIFKNIITNNKTLTKFIKKVVDRFSPRMPTLQYGSFEVGIAIDTLTSDLDYNVDFDWKSRIIEGFKRDVLDVNYANEAEATLISERFDPESRKRIYEPFMKVLENPEMKVSVKSADRSLNKDYSKNPIKESFKRIIIPKPTKEEEVANNERRVRLVTLTFALEEGEDLSKINVKKLRDGLLFGDEKAETDYVIHSPFQHQGLSFVLKSEIKSVFELEPNGVQRIYNTDLDLLAEGDVFKEVENSFKDELLNLFYEYSAAMEQDKAKGDTRFLELEKHLDI